ncbi:protein bric-a-brac 1-like isoform X1 [Photinus pyralis]|uniref:protein bric-a-brac 1-like isoform X1 n=1 Tax=Photinus pyralis TaxID=7054 RepID=UPI0012675A4B|nr:protein bric-a-brac 1-like isoform X1 [Photinus pyralis]XP_031346809.1 protein bric-a-brac 1-like isoform X1 [Photinus pyralis]XP_031346810.1 protein bric-a-brac 1-like isoform X1 [Photinus pyralis]
MTMQQYCLRWNNHQPNFISVFSSLLNNESLVDVTLAAEGRHLQAHKVVLSACSSYFQSLFTINPCQHPIVILKDVKFLDLKVMVDFMYYGEVNVSQEQLPHILKTAEMLKIKGLADIPVDQSALTKSHNSSTDRAELLTPGDSNWSSDEIQRHSLSPSPCPLSPASKRKRLRKTSTGSGSGSAERTSEDHPHSEVTLTSPGGSTLATVIKADPGAFTSENSTPIRSKQHSSESELHRGSSHESVDCDPPLQITLQVPQQDTSHNLDSQAPLEIAGPSAVPQQNSDRTNATIQQSTQSNQVVMGTKRGRFLMRQPRIKRESDPSQTSETDPLSLQNLLAPPIRMERQCSDPLPSISPPPGNLLTVPGTLVKQHSHPLLPSELQQQIQITQPTPLHIHIIQGTSQSESDRSPSPIVVVSESFSSSQEVTTARSDSGGVGPSATATATLRVRTDELKRSVSSPQASTRLSHCPVVRPGPALGCNYCWNTVDNHGRILRRKTKYHCPECQTNLCIVPCFQEYHERHVSTSQTDPLALTTSVMRTIFPKTSSM